MRITKLDCVMNYVGIGALCVAAFCWGWNYDLVKKDKVGSYVKIK